MSWYLYTVPCVIYCVLLLFCKKNSFSIKKEKELQFGYSVTKACLLPAGRPHVPVSGLPGRLYHACGLEGMAFMDVWKLRCQTLPKYAHEIAKIPLESSTVPRGVFVQELGRSHRRAF